MPSSVTSPRPAPRRPGGGGRPGRRHPARSGRPRRRAARPLGARPGGLFWPTSSSSSTDSSGRRRRRRRRSDRRHHRRADRGARSCALRDASRAARHAGPLPRGRLRCAAAHDQGDRHAGERIDALAGRLRGAARGARGGPCQPAAGRLPLPFVAAALDDVPGVCRAGRRRPAPRAAAALGLAQRAFDRGGPGPLTRPRPRPGPPIFFSFSLFSFPSCGL